MALPPPPPYAYYLVSCISSCEMIKHLNIGNPIWSGWKAGPPLFGRRVV